MEWATKKEFQQMAKRSRSYIDRLVRDGRLRVAKDGRIRLDDDAMALLDKRKSAGTSGHAAWMREKAKGEVFITKLRELRYQREHGLVKQAVLEGVTGVLHILRDRIRGLPRKMALELAHKDPWFIEQRLREELGQALHDASGAEGSYTPGPRVPSGPLGNAPRTFIYNRNRELIAITLGQEMDGSQPWLTSRDAGWYFVDEFFDAQGQPVDPPRVESGQVIGGIPTREFVNCDGWRCREKASGGLPDVYDTTTDTWLSFHEYRRKVNGETNSKQAGPRPN